MKNNLFEIMFPLVQGSATFFGVFQAIHIMSSLCSVSTRSFVPPTVVLVSVNQAFHSYNIVHRECKKNVNYH